MRATSILLVMVMYARSADVEALSELAKAGAVEKRYDEAAALWDKALQAAPGHFGSLFNFGFMRYSQGLHADAEKLLARAARVQPGDFNARYVLGLTLIQLDRREDALRQWRAALAIQPANLKLMLVMTVEYGRGRYFREACNLGRKAVTRAPQDERAHLIAIKACQDAGDAGAFDLAQKAAKLFPDSARTNFEYAFQLHKAGRSEESLPLLQKAMRNDPAYEEPHFLYGELLLARDEFEEAATHFRSALRIRKDFVGACVSLARALVGAVKDHDAVRELRRCIEINPTHPQPRLLLSQIYFRLGDEQAAEKEKNESLRLRRANPEAMEAPQGRPFP